MSDSENETTSPAPNQAPAPVRDASETPGAPATGAETGGTDTVADGGSDGAPGTRPDAGILGASETMPPIPDEIREAARVSPDHWLGMVDPNWTGEGTPPDWALVGRWRSGLDGEIVEWQDNEDYRPSPGALGWPDPTDEVDAAVQLAATGYGPGDAVVTALAAHEVAFFTQLGGGPLPALTPDGTPVVPVFTSPVHLHAAGRLAFELVKVPDLLDQVPEGHLLYLNPSGPVSMTVELDVLREEIEGAPAARPEEAPPAAPSPARPIATVSGSPDTLAATDPRSGSEDTAEPTAEPTAEEGAAEEGAAGAANGSSEDAGQTRGAEG